MIDVTKTKGINDEICAHSVKGCEVGTDHVARRKHIKLNSNPCNATFLDR